MSLEAWKSFFEIGGVVLLAATFIFGAGALIVNNRLNEINSKELEAFKLRFEGEQQKTALAQREAAEAKQLAGGFERDIATANQRAAEANDRATKTEAGIAAARADAAKSNLLAEQERLARVKIEEKLAPRTLTSDEIRGIADKISPLGSQRIDFFLYPNDPEIMRIAQLVANSLKGWTVKAFQPLGGGTVSGMLVEYDPSDSSATRRAGALVDALRACRLEVAGPVASLPTPKSQLPAYLGDGTVDASIRLTVGRK
jgi:hypothetical protein